jgi:mono/diheme cytochrome c family protein
MRAPQPLNGPVADDDMTTPKARGEHLVMIAVCHDCHTPQASAGQLNEKLSFAGGVVLDGYAENKKLASANITPDPTGIPYYDEAIFIKTIRTGQLGARKIDPVMPWSFFRNMTDDDLKAVYAFIHELPPVRHGVDNSEPPTMCPECGNRHGLGEKNHK